ncbi:28S ribosomal protein S9, mitochondrial isoform X3 [Solenopsis invicta]|uniref:28S ribosomal protein S9, mitochondrial isoform X3 n=1 Tax=Solenopsis invicta TaxID=13686 RepID=UPI00193D7A3F|nr:28S ribosomal protein S9, mitochondrial isoform X3 [Solenopsis invicta]XP_039310181.1 28S ribosomal protein S9, mitochondrial isoform X3 [Solenopsis invicta]XP_039310182.1 28S ribosomal protein S9, mitochondrial isoform X3 [Solenopsis invicta]
MRLPLNWLRNSFQLSICNYGIICFYPWFTSSTFNRREQQRCCFISGCHAVLYEFMKKEIVEYEIGKRHLANMMGEDPDCFTQADVDRSIQYLFPSGLFDPKARPMMEHPEKIFPSRKAAEFDESGRPFHSMFYTSKPNYYEVLYNIVDKIKSLNDIENSLIRQGTLPMDRVNLMGTVWLLKHEIEKQVLENISDFEYNYLITSLERLCDHPLSRRATDFIIKYRKTVSTHSTEVVVPPLEHDSTGRPYITVQNCMRKSARGEVTIWGNGSGKIIINGYDIMYFKETHHREQIIFPLLFTNMTDKVDIEATINGGGPTGQSGAIRWGIAWGLRSFVDKPTIERMRVAGLLTRDWRRRERKKFGQEGARRKFAWNKR